MTKAGKPIVIITGASGNIGTALCRALADNYVTVGLDTSPESPASASYKCDMTSDKSVQSVFGQLGKRFGKSIAVVIHLAAYFDFSGESNPLYDNLTVGGTRRVLEALQSFSVGRFIYASTMLVHQPSVPGRTIDESVAIAPAWAYPHSKAQTEKLIAHQAGDMPFTILRLAGLYDEQSAVPTLSHQIARIFEKDWKSHLYSGDMMAGQAFIHSEDLADLFVAVVDRRAELPSRSIYLAGEVETMGYQALQNRIGHLIYGTSEWKTFALPQLIAKPGAYLEARAEPIIPDAIDQGEKPFIRPFMISLASDHYALDITRAREDLGWQPRHRIHDELEPLIENLKKDPKNWYDNNGITLPQWMQTAAAIDANPAQLGAMHQRAIEHQHAQNVWAHFLNTGLALWLVTSPFALGYESTVMVWSDVISGLALMVFALLSVSQRFSAARFVCAGIGLWLLCAPLFSGRLLRQPTSITHWWACW